MNLTHLRDGLSEYGLRLMDHARYLDTPAEKRQNRDNVLVAFTLLGSEYEGWLLARMDDYVAEHGATDDDEVHASDGRTLAVLLVDQFLTKGL